MSFQDSSWNISISRLVILAASVFEISCRKKTYTHKLPSDIRSYSLSTFKKHRNIQNCFMRPYFYPGPLGVIKHLYGLLFRFSDISGVFQRLPEPTKPTAPCLLLSLYGIIYVTWYTSGLPEATGVRLRLPNSHALLVSGRR